MKISMAHNFHNTCNELGIIVRICIKIGESESPHWQALLKLLIVAYRHQAECATYNFHSQAHEIPSALVFFKFHEFSYSLKYFESMGLLLKRIISLLVYPRIFYPHFSPLLLFLIWSIHLVLPLSRFSSFCVQCSYYYTL